MNGAGAWRQCHSPYVTFRFAQPGARSSFVLPPLSTVGNARRRASATASGSHPGALALDCDDDICCWDIVCRIQDANMDTVRWQSVTIYHLGTPHHAKMARVSSDGCECRTAPMPRATRTILSSRSYAPNGPRRHARRRTFPRSRCGEWLSFVDSPADLPRESSRPPMLGYANAPGHTRITGYAWSAMLSPSQLAEALLAGRGRGNLPGNAEASARAG